MVIKIIMKNDLNILIEKSFSEGSIRIEGVASKMKRDAAIARRIDEKWAELLRVAVRDELLMFNGPLVRFEGFSADDGLKFFVSRICFKDVMGARPAQDIYEKYGMDYLANSFSTFSVAVTSDNKIPIVLRSSTADFNDMWALPCGFVHPETDVSNPARTSRRTVAADLGIGEDIIRENHFMGLYEYPDISETTACFHLEMDCDSRRIEKEVDASDATSGRLHTRFIFIDASSDAIREFLSRHGNDAHPGTLMSLRMYNHTMHNGC